MIQHPFFPFLKTNNFVRVMHPRADANEAFLITVSIVLMKRVIALCPAIECRWFPKGVGSSRELEYALSLEANAGRFNSSYASNNVFLDYVRSNRGG